MYLQAFTEFRAFKGFMIQARTVADDSPAGHFINSTSTTYQTQCDGDVSVQLPIIIHGCVYTYMYHMYKYMFIYNIYNIYNIYDIYDIYNTYIYGFIVFTDSCDSYK